MLRLPLVAICIAIAGFPLLAQMTGEQREHEFRNLVGLYARTYAPNSWKIQSLGVNILDVQHWINRVRNAKTDVEFFEICSEYVATFQDGHSVHFMNSRFYADIGLLTDIYDGKVLIEAVDRSRYPIAEFPIRVGDEVVSIDGVAVNDVLDTLSKYRGSGNPHAVRRTAADYLFYRHQQIYPNAVDIGDKAQVVIRDGEGELRSYTFSWKKSGVPFRSVSPTPWPHFNTPGLLSHPQTTENGEGKFPVQKVNPRWTPLELQWAGISAVEQQGLDRKIVNEAGEEVSRKAVSGRGQVFPYYNPPPGFRLHGLGETFLSGTFTSEGYTIGFIRIAHFSPSDPEWEAYIFDSEVNYLRNNTDGLVIDDTRNTGGYGCLALDYAQRLIPYPFNFPRIHIRPTQQYINSMNQSLQAAKSRGAEDWIINTYQFYLDDLMTTIKRPGSVTGAVPFCVPFTGRDWAPTVENYPVQDKNGNVAAYDKPLIVLVDEFSASTGDIFPAVIQDAKRGLLVGMRTAGLGGSVSSMRNGVFSESVAYFTQSLLVRDTETAAPGIPPSKFIENVGVVPDVELDYMKKENLITGGRPFVEKFTSIIVEQIRKSQEGQ